MTVSTQTETKRLQVRRTIRASREEVFRAWTEPEHLEKWFHPDPSYATPVAEVDLRRGGRYRFVMETESGDRHVVSGVFREIELPAKLAFTWGWEEGDGEPETLVTVELLERDGGTEVVLTHEGFAGAEERDDHRKGWEGCLEQLEAHLAA